jgi:hypothetical protein
VVRESGAKDYSSFRPLPVVNDVDHTVQDLYLQCAVLAVNPLFVEVTDDWSVALEEFVEDEHRVVASKYVSEALLHHHTAVLLLDVQHAVQQYDIGCAVGILESLDNTYADR